MKSRRSNPKKKLKRLHSVIVEMNVKSGSFFNQTLTDVLTVEIYRNFEYTDYIFKTLQSDRGSINDYIPIIVKATTGLPYSSFDYIECSQRNSQRNNVVKWTL